MHQIRTVCPRDLFGLPGGPYRKPPPGKRVPAAVNAKRVSRVTAGIDHHLTDPSVYEAPLSLSAKRAHPVMRSVRGTDTEAPPAEDVG